MPDSGSRLSVFWSKSRMHVAEAGEVPEERPVVGDRPHVEAVRRVEVVELVVGQGDDLVDHVAVGRPARRVAELGALAPLPIWSVTRATSAGVNGVCFTRIVEMRGRRQVARRGDDHDVAGRVLDAELARAPRGPCSRSGSCGSACWRSRPHRTARPGCRRAAGGRGSLHRLASCTGSSRRARTPRRWRRWRPRSCRAPGTRRGRTSSSLRARYERPSPMHVVDARAGRRGGPCSRRTRPVTRSWVTGLSSIASMLAGVEVERGEDLVAAGGADDHHVVRPCDPTPANGNDRMSVSKRSRLDRSPSHSERREPTRPSW